MALITSSADTTLLAVSPTVKSIRSTRYSVRGDAGGQAAAYAAGMTAQTLLTAGVGPFLALYGSASRVVRPTLILVNGSIATTLSYVEIRVTLFNRRDPLKQTTANVTDLTAVPLDLSSPPSTVSLCALLTGATNVIGFGPSVVIGTRFMTWGITAAGSNSRSLAQTQAPSTGMFEMRFTDEGEPLVLRDPMQGIEVGFTSAPGTAPTIMAMLAWTEDLT